MTYELNLSAGWFGDRAREARAPLCRDCGWQGPWVDAHDRTDTTYGDTSSAHVASTGHRKIADIKVTYSPGEVVDLPTASRKARRPLGKRAQ